MPDRRLALAVLVSSVLVLAAPFVGDLRAAVRDALPDHYRLVIGSVVGVGVATALLVALLRIRDRRALRYSGLATALAIGFVYARTVATGNADVDVVERFHFVEYGAVALLFYRVWRDRDDVMTVAAPLLAGVLTALADEWLQWFIPGRVGELHDVLLDSVALACGLMVAIAAHPPRALAPVIGERSRPTALALPVAVLLLGAAFFHIVHLGDEIQHGSNTFRSRFSRAQLDDAMRDRAERWRSQPPLTAARLSREDQYLSEALWHVQRRNQLAGSDALAAWRENAIVERYFAPVLDTPTYASPSGARWPPAQRADMEGRAADHGGPYVSDAAPFPIYPWSRTRFWLAIAIVFLLLALTMRRMWPRRRALTVTTS